MYVVYYLCGGSRKKFTLNFFLERVIFIPTLHLDVVIVPTPKYYNYVKEFS